VKDLPTSYRPVQLALFKENNRHIQVPPALAVRQLPADILTDPSTCNGTVGLLSVSQRDPTALLYRREKLPKSAAGTNV
jgi:hypothetical protein